MIIFGRHARSGSYWKRIKARVLGRLKWGTGPSLASYSSMWPLKRDFMYGRMTWIEKYNSAMLRKGEWRGEWFITWVLSTIKCMGIFPRALCDANRILEQNGLFPHATWTKIIRFMKKFEGSWHIQCFSDKTSRPNKDRVPPSLGLQLPGPLAALQTSEWAGKN